MSERDRTKLRDIVGRIQVIREELAELEGADEGIVRLVAHSAGNALNWIALASEKPEAKDFDSCCRALEEIDLDQASLPIIADATIQNSLDHAARLVR
jgi:hypothetical protein